MLLHFLLSIFLMVRIIKIWLFSHELHPSNSFNILKSTIIFCLSVFPFDLQNKQTVDVRAEVRYCEPLLYSPFLYFSQGHVWIMEFCNDLIKSEENDGETDLYHVISSFCLYLSYPTFHT